MIAYKVTAQVNSRQWSAMWPWLPGVAIEYPVSQTIYATDRPMFVYANEAAALYFAQYVVNTANHVHKIKVDSVNVWRCEVGLCDEQRYDVAKLYGTPETAAQNVRNYWYGGECYKELRHLSTRFATSVTLLDMVAEYKYGAITPEVPDTNEVFIQTCGRYTTISAGGFVAQIDNDGTNNPLVKVVGWPGWLPRDKAVSDAEKVIEKVKAVESEA